MLDYLRNFSTFPFVILEISNNLRLQKSFIKKHLKSELDVFIEENDGSINNKDIKRILNLYALIVPIFCERLFCALRNENISQKEKLSITYLASLTGLFDDLFDAKNTTESRAKQLIESATESGDNSLEKMMLHLWKKANENTTHSSLLKQNATTVFKAQSESRKQKTTVLTNEELKQITFQKGGVSLVFYFSVLNQALSENEKKLLHLFGAFIQLIDDFFDTYEDHQEGINTLVTTESDIKKTLALYEILIHEFQEEVNQSLLESKNKKTILSYFYFTASRGLVCIDMLQARQKERNGIFAVGAYSRKELICDMENPLNFLKSWHYYAKLMSRLP